MTDNFSLPITAKCPNCKTQAVSIHKNKIACNNCSFSTEYNCPICNNSIQHAQFGTAKEHALFQCKFCGSKVELRKIKYLIENQLYVDQAQRCDICNGPTIHQKEMNLSHRCFFYPACAGQVDLFGSKQSESLVFIDFETTGLEIGKDCLIEVGAVKIDSEGYEHVFQSFIRPPHALPENIMQITGISQDMVENAPELKPTLEKLAEFIGTSTLVAHNVEFDIPWLMVSVLRHNIQLQTNETVCTLNWAKANQEPRSGLGALTKKYQIRHRNAHRALADAAATKELFFIFDNMKKAPQPRRLLQEFVPLSQRLMDRFKEFVQE